ncbi:hypothetical protein F443_21047 [Phytophthora nicotianae P1569]|uniref:Uncharacterized protein n=1 Tax=Phytophthora nicotianae P1569 TaxID=1317065 RepID=V9DYZ8_PHYNI|nr:hypothetical protein F443_21047 [Phytophthora nicotianae P1569]
MQSWNVMRQCRPFVVAGEGLRLADEGNQTADRKTNAGDVLHMLPVDVFAQRVAGSNRRSMFVGSTPQEQNITAANEAAVVAFLVKYFYALGDHERAIKFFESYSRDRMNWLKERSAVEAGAGGFPRASKTLSSSVSGFVRATRLWAPARSAYLELLMAKHNYHKIAQFARQDTRNLETACESAMTAASLLIGCRKGKDRTLARLVIETMAQKNPVSVLPLPPYELAIKAAIQKKNRSESDLENALWIARVMQDDAAYVLHPDLWFALFNTSLHLKQKDRALSFALETFGLHSKNFTALYQGPFRRALRKACRLNRSDVVMGMMREWLAAADGVDAEAKTQVLGFVLREMLYRGFPMSSITELLDVMESFHIETSRVMLQRIVRTILDDAHETRSPHESMKSSLEFWKTHTNVQNPVYVMYVLIQQCLERGWFDECELVVKEIAKRRFLAVHATASSPSWI